MHIINTRMLKRITAHLLFVLVKLGIKDDFTLYKMVEMDSIYSLLIQVLYLQVKSIQTIQDGKNVLHRVPNRLWMPINKDET